MLRNIQDLGFVLLAKYNSGDQIQGSGMGGPCDTHGAEEKCIQCFYKET